jgi:hypothetical protein
MVGRRFHLAAIVLIVAVAAESILGAVAHRHGHATTAAGCPSAESAGVGTHPETHSDDSDHHAPPASPGHHDPNDCPACQYLAKHALPAVVLDISCVVQLSDVVVQQDAVSDGSSEISLPLARGPPALS